MSGSDKKIDYSQMWIDSGILLIYTIGMLEFQRWFISCLTLFSGAEREQKMKDCNEIAERGQLIYHANFSFYHLLRDYSFLFLYSRRNEGDNRAVCKRFIRQKIQGWKSIGNWKKYQIFWCTPNQTMKNAWKCIQWTFGLKKA